MTASMPSRGYEDCGAWHALNFGSDRGFVLAPSPCAIKREVRK